MPGSTALGIRYPLSSEAPAGHSNMQTLAGDVDALIGDRDAMCVSNVAANQGPVAATGNIWIGGHSLIYSSGPPAVGAGGITVSKAGWWEFTAWARLQSSVAGNNTGLILGDGTTPYGAAYLPAMNSGESGTAWIRRLINVAAGFTIRTGYINPIANGTIYTGGGPYNGLQAKWLKT